MAGTGRAAIATPVQAFIQRNLTRHRGLATGLAGSGTGLGILILAPLTGYFISNYGWRNSYLYLGVIFFVLAIPAAISLIPQKRPQATGEGSGASPARQEETAPDPSRSGLRDAGNTSSAGRSG